ncbi:hypothetical protein HPB51_000269 [Rhipicephalus microplus]|uniref:CCHC-type domain-containing protein n=1 Tax=Rhipicephalus microplus TaxID=6941 RepID=A0A9J6DRS3_RHIMP|nr:hypothetical protein HPB51_000269 [Rhipicephalus microplus]
MESSSRAATAADAGRGTASPLVPKDYRIILPSLPSGEAMRRAVALHCDVSGRPYRIDDFRKPLKDLGVIHQVSGIGAYQMSHVWLLNMKTVEAKKALTDAGVLKVKDRACLVIDPTRQEVKMKLHWLAFDVTKDAIRRAFYEYGDVKEVTDDRWRVEDFEGVESTTRVIRMQLRDGVSVDQLPHQVRIGSSTALVVVPGRPPLCLRCRSTGHMRRDCKVPRCSECHSFGHEQDECNRSYARAAGRRPETQQSELLMDEEESEQASLPATPQKQTTSDDTPVLKKSKQVSSALDTNAERKMGSQAAPTTSEQTRPAPAMHATSQLQATRPETPASQANAASTPLNSASQHSLANETHENEDLPSDLDTLSMELESASAKRRRDSDDGAQVDETQVKSEVQWKVVSGGKKRNAARQRSSSLKRDDGSSN